MRLQTICLLSSLCVAATAAGAQSPSASLDGPEGSAEAGWAVQEAFAHGEYAKADALFAKYCTTADRLGDGRWELSGVNESLQSLFDSYAEWDMMFRKLAEWRQDAPDSVASKYVEAILWTSWAWSARGTGYADSVTPEGWRLFRERLNKASDLLARSKDKAADCPLYYEVSQKILLGLGGDNETKTAVFEAGVKRFPDYWPIYYQRALSLMPHWGGSYEEVDAFVNDVTKRDLGNEGEALYARIYRWVDSREEVSFELFRDSPASWKRMKAGFELLRRKYPNSQWILHNFAAYACRAADESTYQRLRKQITRPYALAWPTNLSMEVCDQQLMMPV